MNCKKAAQMIDYIDDKLSSIEKSLMENHISQCVECKKMLSETQIVIQKINDISLNHPSSNLKKSFDEMLEKEEELVSKKRITNLGKNRIIPLKYLQIAASIVILLSGYLIGHYSTNGKNQTEILALKDNALLLKKDLILSKLDSKSPTERIKALDEAMSLGSMDSDLIEALKDRIRYDSNVSVRLATVLSLSNFEKLDVFTTELIETLVNEKNPSVQIEIVQALVKIGDKKAIIPMQKLLAEGGIRPLVKSELNFSIAQLKNIKI